MAQVSFRSDCPAKQLYVYTRDDTNNRLTLSLGRRSPVQRRTHSVVLARVQFWSRTRSDLDLCLQKYVASPEIILPSHRSYPCIWPSQSEVFLVELVLEALSTSRRMLLLPRL